MFIALTDFLFAPFETSSNLAKQMRLQQFKNTVATALR
jgi:hypothetical protein